MKLDQANNSSIQELMDYAVKAIVAQGKQAIDPDLVENNNCVYFSDIEGDNGKPCRCAVGWLLDHDLIANVHGLSIPSCSVLGLVENDELEDYIPAPLVTNQILFGYLQEFHDSVFSSSRAHTLSVIMEHGIDTSGEHWAKWVSMGIGKS